MTVANPTAPQRAITPPATDLRPTTATAAAATSSSSRTPLNSLSNCFSGEELNGKNKTGEDRNRVEKEAYL